MQDHKLTTGIPLPSGNFKLGMLAAAVSELILNEFLEATKVVDISSRKWGE